MRITARNVFDSVVDRVEGMSGEHRAVLSDLLAEPLPPILTVQQPHAWLWVDLDLKSCETRGTIPGGSIVPARPTGTRHPGVDLPASGWLGVHAGCGTDYWSRVLSVPTRMRDRDVYVRDVFAPCRWGARVWLDPDDPTRWKRVGDISLHCGVREDETEELAFGALLGFVRVREVIPVVEPHRLHSWHPCPDGVSWRPGCVVTCGTRPRDLHLVRYDKSSGRWSADEGVEAWLFNESAAGLVRPGRYLWRADASVRLDQPIEMKGSLSLQYLPDVIDAARQQLHNLIGEER